MGQKVGRILVSGSKCRTSSPKLKVDFKVQIYKSPIELSTFSTVREKLLDFPNGQIK